MRLLLILLLQLSITAVSGDTVEKVETNLRGGDVALNENNNENHHRGLRNGGTVCQCIRAPCYCGGNKPDELDQDDLETCPETAPYVTCINEPNPVTCGDLNCFYNNGCLASGAGWNVATQCVHKTTGIEECPKPAREVYCAAQYNPVRCGGLSNCLYDNMCKAGAAGFSKYECNRSNDGKDCPGNNPLVLCPFEETEYECGPNKCFYSGKCLATSGAGWNLNEDCVAVTDRDSLSTCPSPDDMTSCSGADIIPVKCTRDDLSCFYPTACHASEAGWNASEECITGEKTCRTPDPEQYCIKIYAPVVCGPEECKYNNLCEAMAAEFKEYECESNNDDKDSCPLPNPAVRCGLSEFSYLCGPNECFYQSMCLATASGYNTSEDCHPIVSDDDDSVNDDSMDDDGMDDDSTDDDDGMYDDDGMDDDGSSDDFTCPAPNPAVRCGLSEYSYTCGENNCFYESMCLATAAGYSVDSECRSLIVDYYYEYDQDGCPITRPEVKCIALFAPIICTRDGIEATCQYSNSCFAQGASWHTDTQCKSVDAECPPPDQKRCRRTNNLVTCSDENHTDCTYESPCLAEAAGFSSYRHCKK